MGSRYGSDKEVAAVTYNLKQQRVLERKMHTLSLERSYSLKLLELNHRTIQVNYRRMKEKVSRIDSFLTAEEIKELAELESSGKLNFFSKPPNVNSSLKIASAEKRLKLNKARPHTAAVSKSSGNANTKSGEVSQVSVAPRSRSVAGFSSSHFNSQSQGSPQSKSSTPRPKTAFVSFLSTPSSTISQKVSRDNSYENRDVKVTPGARSVVRGTHAQKSEIEAGQKPDIPRPKTAFVSISPNSRDNDENNPGRSKSRSTTSDLVQSSYSCHDSNRTGTRTPNSGRAHTARDRNAGTSARRDSTDSNMGSSLFEERKLVMLENEAQRGQKLDCKRQDFLKKVEKYVEEHPAEPTAENCLSVRHLDRQESVVTIPDTAQSHKQKSRKARREEISRLRDDALNKRIKDGWKELTKCRYLRIPNEKQDHSGYVTLASQQLNMLQGFKRTSPTSFLKGLQISG